MTPALTVIGSLVLGLQVGEVREAAIVGGERHRYPVRLEAGQYLDASISPQEVSVVFRLESPDKKPLFEETLPGGTGPKSIEWIADVAGEYTLEVHSTSVATRKGRYRLELKALRSAQPPDRTRYSARMALEEGEQLWGKRRYQESMAAYERALAVAQGLDDPALEGRILNLMGRGLITLGNLEAATEALEVAYEKRHSLGPSIKADALGSLGSLAKAKKNHQESLRCYREARALYQEAGVRVNEALSLHNMGAAYADLGAYADAVEALRSAVGILHEEGVADTEARSLTLLGRCHWMLQEPEEALARHREAEKLCQQIGDQAKLAEIKADIGLGYTLLGDLKKQPAHYDTAVAYLNEALESQKGPENLRGRRGTLQRLRQTYESRGEHDKALDCSRQVLELSKQLPERARGSDWLEFAAHARVENKRGRLVEARGWIEKAIASQEGSRLQIADQDLRAFYEGSVNHLFDLHVDILMQLHQQGGAADLAEAAFQASERGRARALLDTLGEERDGADAETDPARIQRERDLEKAVAAARAQAAGQQDAAARADLRALLLELGDVGARNRRSERRDALRRAEPVTLQAIQELLDEQSVVLEYDLGPERSYLWAITKRSWKSFVLPKEHDLAQLARILPELLATHTKVDTSKGLKGVRAQLAQAERDYAQASRRLSEAILGPVPMTSRVNRLLFVWDGALHYVPVAGLPLPRSWAAGAAARRSPPSLISRYEIVTLPSASVATALARERGIRGPAQKQVAVFADPVFSRSDARLANPAEPRDTAGKGGGGGAPAKSRLVGVTMSGEDLVRLPHTAKLAEEALKLVPAGEGLAAVGFEATRAAVFSPALAEYRMIIFGTHGLFDAEFPALSGIALSFLDAQGQPLDGFLRQHDLYALRLNADLVVLVACQTAMGREIRGEGLVGLSRGFLYAGASRVVASLWRVEETASVELIVGFLRRVKEGKSYAAALRESQLAVARDQRWSAPYFWAGFVIQGDWR